MKNMKKLTIAVLLSFTLLSAACTSNQTEEQRKAEAIKKYSNVTMTSSDQIDPVHGKQARMWYGAVSGISSVNANGVAFLRQYEDGTFIATANVNILQAPEGKFYAAWFLDGNGSNAVLAGTLRSIVGDARHSVSLETKTNLTDYTHLLVTLEDSEKPVQPGVQQAEGILKEVVKK